MFKKLLPLLLVVAMLLSFAGTALAEGEKAWREYLRVIAATGREHWALLEFVRNDSVEQFLEDAETLKRTINTVCAGED